MSVSSFHVVTCEHASNALPEEPALGVPEELLQTHSAWDPGAREVATELARRLGAPIELGRYSRLLVDLNRSADNHEAVVPTVCYGVTVPGNRHLSDIDRQQRIQRFHTPYRAAIATHIERAIEQFGRCTWISIHSFTPELDPENRRFDVGIMYDRAISREEAIVRRLEKALTRHGRSFERNRPYDGQADSVFTGLRGRWPSEELVCVELELNQSMMKGDWVLPIVEAILAGVRA